MKLVFSTSKFKVGNRSYAGFPILLHNSMKTFNEGMSFLTYHCIKRGRVASKRSWVTYGRDLYDFFAFVEANNLNWRSIEDPLNSHILAVYRDASIENFGLSEATVNRRLRLAIKFYQYAKLQGWVANLPYAIEEIKVNQPKGFLAHADKSGGIKATADVLLKRRETRVKVLSTEQVGMLLSTITNKQDKLMVRLCLTTGLRKEELLTFPVDYIVNPQRLPLTNNYVTRLSPNDMALKGAHERSIHLPKSLMEDLWQFVIHERSELSQKSSEVYPNLFLNKEGRPFSVTSNGFNYMIKRLGLPFHVSPHMLRHTYATHTLKALMMRKGLSFNPLLYVRDRLGHSSITTTEKYLHFIDDVSDGVLNEYQREIDAILSAV